jgi:hypothetical protein
MARKIWSKTWISIAGNLAWTRHAPAESIVHKVDHAEEIFEGGEWAKELSGRGG